MIDEVTFTDAEWARMLSDPAFGYVCRNGHRLSDSDRRFIEVEGICPACFGEAEAAYEDEAYAEEGEDEGDAIDADGDDEDTLPENATGKS